MPGMSLSAIGGCLPSLTLIGEHCAMRIVLSLLSVLAATALAGCAHGRGERLSWKDRSILPEHESIASLNECANAGEALAFREDRACAIFTLFARYIRPGASAEQVHRALANTNWMGDIDLAAITGLGGWIPIDWKDSVFSLELFPVKHYREDGGRWVIYLRLSGSSRPSEEALAFLRGDGGLPGEPKLEEFALCFPSRPEQNRIERFTRRGLHVYESQGF